MRLPGFKRLIKGDYPEDQQGLVEKLSEALNSGIEALYELGNKKISLRDNILCTVRDVDVTVDASGVPVTNTVISLDGTGRVEGVTVINAFNNNNTALTPTGQPFIVFQAQASAITVKKVTGLAAGSSWKLRVIIWQA